ncbi:hypothetical protein OGAPHI_002849 [Ogataea philodendri]|uniref:Uncharacterized protein n=1 Tax=Ogataea philodendri TaxID=1378263 RepID=A0A9P8P8L6_9ASCO|nr:uncharacterized protein OGAPHI_002849 [Ogataea philodendri]KAH3667200.1 hypothetical protein OGAPHI_002849 [Ogataea philodendri]
MKMLKMLVLLSMKGLLKIKATHSNENGSQENVEQMNGHPEIVVGLVLSIQESKLVQNLLISEKKVCWVLELSHRSGSSKKNSDRGIDHHDQCNCQNCDCKHNTSSRINSCEFPNTQERECWESDVVQSVKTSFDDRSVMVSEPNNFVSLDCSCSCHQLTNSFENGGQHKQRETNKEEENDTCHEDVGDLDVGQISNSLDTSKNQSFRSNIVLIGGVQTRVAQDIARRVRAFGGDSFHKSQFLQHLLNRDRNHRLALQDRGDFSASCLDIPVNHILHELDTDNTQRPHEILSPGSGDWWNQRDTHHGGESQVLEVDEKRSGIRGDVGRSGGVAENRHKRRHHQSETRNNGNRPSGVSSLHTLAVGHGCLDTGERIGSVCVIC